MKSKQYAAIQKGRCVSCGACVKECPRKAIEIWRGCYARIDEAACVGCGRCMAVCPAGSIALVKRESLYE